MSDPYSRWALIAVLLALNAFLSLGKGAFCAVNRAALNRRAEEGNKKAKSICAISDRSELFLTAVRAGKTVSKLGAFVLLLSLLAPVLSSALSPNTLLGDVLTILVTVLITALLFLFLGERYPARCAEQKADKLLPVLWTPLRIVAGIFYPIALAVEGLTAMLLTLTGFRLHADDALSKEEIQDLVEESGESGMIEESEREMIEGILDFNAKTAEEVMTPRTETYMIDADRPLDEYLDEMLNEKYSRVPVYRGEIDNIVGVLYLKDFMCEARRVGFENVRIDRCIHEPYFVPERKRIDALYRELRESKNHMAILIDEYGGLSGVVTIEDLIEEVMGDIDDEYDEEDSDIRPEKDGSCVVDGATPIEKINEVLGTELNEDDEDYDTVGGLIIKLLGYIPTEDEKINMEYDGCAFTVEKIGDKRIESVRILPLPKKDGDADREEKGN